MISLLQLLRIQCKSVYDREYLDMGGEGRVTRYHISRLLGFLQVNFFFFFGFSLIDGMF